MFSVGLLLTGVKSVSYNEAPHNRLDIKLQSDSAVKEGDTRDSEGIGGGVVRSAETEVKLENMRVAELIEKLQEVSEEGVGFHSTASESAFIATEDDAKFDGGVLGSRKPAVSPVMRELVKKGVEAIPELINHLSDSRETKVTVGATGFHTAIWHSDEYDPRHADPKLHPAGVNKVGHDWSVDRQVDQYTLRVGDLCYVIVGQIVNRKLNAVRYQPTACLVINSPIETPELAEVVRKDWAGLTHEEHKKSLLADAADRPSLRFSGAAKRLLFYYQIDVVEALKASAYRRIVLLFGIVFIVMLGIFLAKRLKERRVKHV